MTKNHEAIIHKIKELLKQFCSTETEVKKVIERYSKNKIVSSVVWLDHIEEDQASNFLNYLQIEFSAPEPVIVPNGEIWDVINKKAQVQVKEIQKEEPKQEIDMLPVPSKEEMLNNAMVQTSCETGIITLENIEKVNQMMEKIYDMAISKIKTFPKEYFVRFGNSVCITGAGIDRFISGMILPIKLMNVNKMLDFIDDKGYKTYIYEASAVNTLTGMAIPVMSQESEAKSFYCIRKDYNGNRIELPPEKINHSDVRMAAFRGLRKEAVKMFFGLRGITEEEAKKLGIPVDSINVAKK